MVTFLQQWCTWKPSDGEPAGGSSRPTRFWNKMHGKRWRNVVSRLLLLSVMCFHVIIITAELENLLMRCFFKHILTHDKTCCLMTGLLHVKTSRAACSCGHRSLSPCGKCSTKATGTKTNPHPVASAAPKMSVACSQTARWEPEGCLLLRYVCVKSSKKIRYESPGKFLLILGSSHQYLI